MRNPAPDSHSSMAIVAMRIRPLEPSTVFASRPVAFSAASTAG